jgi:probable rRNA maturation factor
MSWEIDVIAEDPRWEDLEPLAMRAVKATRAHLGLAGSHEFCILGCNDARIQELNTEFRDKPAATNVLSWPYEDLCAQIKGGLPRPPVASELGDIALAYETCMAEAKEQQKTASDHVTHLIIHALLHLLGYDHVCDADATVMEQLETEILGNLGIADPYRGQDLT